MKTYPAAVFLSSLVVAAAALSGCAASVGDTDDVSPTNAGSPTETYPGGIDDDGRGSADEEWCNTLVNSSWENEADTLTPDGVREEIGRLKREAPDDLKGDFQVLLDNKFEEFDPSWEENTELVNALDNIAVAQAGCIAQFGP
ncbi:MAG: hypothetical protein FWD11_06900 [Micrococcales bacterium]|nr:hypothetical protein [Micrococcales bacterium]